VVPAHRDHGRHLRVLGSPSNRQMEMGTHQLRLL